PDLVASTSSTTATTAPEIRLDQLTGLRTILAPGRAARPDNFQTRRSEPKGGENCPFCEGHEDRTPPEGSALRPGGGAPPASGRWRTRVVPNLYPALGAPEGDGAAAGAAGGPGAEAGAFASSGDPLLASRRAGEPDLFSARPATGAHEVVIHSPRH